jgi:hypothetical protein
MKQRLTIILTSLSLAISVDACKKHFEDTLGPIESVNLVSNGSFESDTSFSTSHWQINGVSGCYERSIDVPSSGGNYSIAFKICGFAPQEFSQLIAAKPGRHVYRFEYSVKNVHGGTEVFFGINRSDSTMVRYDQEFSLTETDSAWRRCASIDTIETILGDSLNIILRGSLDNAPHLVTSKTLFDLIELVELQ